MRFLKPLVATLMAMGMLASVPASAHTQTPLDEDGRTLEDYGVVETYENEYITLEDGTVLPLHGTIDPSKATPLTDDELAEQGIDPDTFQDEDAIQPMAVVSCTSPSAVYRWYSTTGSDRCFSPPGGSWNTTVSHVCVFQNSFNYEARTRYTLPGQGTIWSPWRGVGCWNFTAPVVAWSAEIRQGFG